MTKHHAECLLAGYDQPGTPPRCHPACVAELLSCAALQSQRALLFHCDALRAAALPPGEIHALVCDPPAGIAFMGKEWDDFPDRGTFAAAFAPVFAAGFAALKPGAFAAVWALPRTSHWTANALEDAGFEIRDVIDHLFGTGFPKSLDVGRQIDMERCALPGRHCDKNLPKKRRPDDHLCPAHPDGEPWRGYKTALKPGKEHWILARKPLAGTVAENVLAHGAGALNVDGCRVETGPRPLRLKDGSGVADPRASTDFPQTSGYAAGETSFGRWPANVIFSHGPQCDPIGLAIVRANGATTGAEPSAAAAAAALHGNVLPRLAWAPHGNGDGTETVIEWECEPGCPVALIDEQSGVLHARGNKTATKQGGFLRNWRDGESEGAASLGGVNSGDAGGASRYYTTLPGFIYAAKPSRGERDAGCAHLPVRTGGEATGRDDDSIGVQNPRAGAGRTGGARNHHPTVKSIALMRYLCRLITPPGGTVLDLFTGSGSTGVAALAEGFRFVGFERELEYVEIAKARLIHAWVQGSA
jgi:hypothetical protein